MLSATTTPETALALQQTGCVLAGAELRELGQCALQEVQLMMCLPAVEGSHQAVVLHKASSTSHSTALPSLVLPLLHGQAEAAILQSPGCLLQHCLAAVLPMRDALPLQQNGVPITLEAKGCSQANLQDMVEVKPVLHCVTMQAVLQMLKSLTRMRHPIMQ